MVKIMNAVQFFLIGFLSSFVFTECASARSGIVSGLSGGRLGDNLVAVAHAAWLSHIYGYELGYMPFEYSDKLVLRYTARRYTKEWVDLFSTVIRHGTKPTLEQDVVAHARGACTIIPYFSEFLSEYGTCPEFAHLKTIPFRVNWHDASFKELLRHLFKPVDTVRLFSLPADRISVALHMRRGGGFDAPPSDGTSYSGSSFDRGAPLKCPPIRFYIDQLISLYENLGQRPLYVFVFTDDRSPESLVDQVKKWIGTRDIIFDWRKSGNSHESNVLEDFVNMQRFDCMIRAQSNLSYMAARLGAPRIEIEPYASRWDDKWLVITHARIMFSDSTERVVECSAEQYRSHE
jgi:hypothetical protein